MSSVPPQSFKPYTTSTNDIQNTDLMKFELFFRTVWTSFAKYNALMVHGKGLGLCASHMVAGLDLRHMHVWDTALIRRMCPERL